jgi:hypothetical protein
MKRNTRLRKPNRRKAKLALPDLEHTEAAAYRPTRMLTPLSFSSGMTCSVFGVIPLRWGRNECVVPYIT